MLLERLLALMTGVIVAICLGLGLVMMAFGPGKKATEHTPAPAAEAAPAQAEPEAASAHERAAARASVEKTIGGAPEYRRFFERLRETFPADYDAVVEAFASDRLSGRGETSVDDYLSEAVRQLRQSRGVLAAKAEPSALARVFDLRLEVVRALSAEDKRLCVAFLYGGADQDFHKFAARRRALVAEMASAGLEAIFSGQTKSIERAPPSEEDFRALENALVARGLGKVEIGALLDGGTPDPPLDDKRMCGAGQTYLEVLRTLPEAIRLRIYGLVVELMARS